ncbi:MAG: IMPACT family protein [Clostridiales bacterium]|nr:IMPACT family protein [Clostridiales bacterium]
MIEKFKTIYKHAQEELIEKKSRFIGQASPVEAEAGALEFIESVRKKHYNASHTVFAYIIGHSDYCRYSDDGEPSGTAGMPILNMLKSEPLTNIAVTVTRYFGGTLLGTGGLARAYQAAAKQAVNSAGIIEKALYQKISIACGYDLSGKIKYNILENENIILDTIYTGLVEYIVLAKISETGQFLELIRDLSSGTIKPTILEQVWRVT